MFSVRSRIKDVFLNAAFVDEYVQAAKLLYRTLDGFLAEFGSATSPEMTMQRRPSFSTAALVFRGVVVLVEICDGDVRAFACVQNGDCAPDAGIGPGDERHLALQLFRSLVMGCVIHRREIELGFFAGFWRCVAWVVAAG